MNSEEYINERVHKQQKYFSKKAGRLKKQYLLWSCIKLISALCITILSSFLGEPQWIGVVIGILSAFVAFIEGVLILFKFNESWLLNRSTSEYLKAEEFLFKTHTGDYESLTDSEAFNLFVPKIEALIHSNNIQWKKVYKSKEEK